MEAIKNAAAAAIGGVETTNRNTLSQYELALDYAIKYLLTRLFLFFFFYSFQQHYRGPAQIIAEAAGVVKPANTEHTNGSPYITSNFGQPWPADGQHALNVGGLPVTSDPFLFEKQQTFVREKVVERRVHACGSGHFGYFEATKDVSHLTKAAFLSEVGKKTPLFLRFSTVTFGKEFPDLGRNPRGFAIKMYTEEGNYG